MEDVVGFRFHPTEEEMIKYYLERKLLGLDFPIHVINEVCMNELEPSELPAYSAIQSDDRVWYFFTAADYMDAKKIRINRKTPAGYWKVTGKDRIVKDRHGREIGLKKTLVFHKGRSPNGVGTSWAMQEFHYKDATRLYSRPYVLCRLKWKSDDRHEPSTHSASNSGNHSAVNVFSQENNQQSLNWLSNLQNCEFYDNSIPEVLTFPAERPSSSNVSSIEPNASRSPLNPLDTSKQDDDFVNSLWATEVDEGIHEEEQDMLLANNVDEHIHEETVQAHSHDFYPVKLLGGYGETVHPQKGELVETSSLFRGLSQDDNVLHAFGRYKLQMNDVGLHNKEGTSLSRMRSLKTVQTSGKAENASLLRGRYELQGNYMHHTRGVAEMTGGGALHKKEETSLSREKIVQISGKASSKLLSDGSNGSSRKSSFIFLETPPSSHKQDPPSVYIVNIVIALILLVVFVREMASLH